MVWHAAKFMHSSAHHALSSAFGYLHLLSIEYRGTELLVPCLSHWAGLSFQIVFQFEIISKRVADSIPLGVSLPDPTAANIDLQRVKRAFTATALTMNRILPP